MEQALLVLTGDAAEFVNEFVDVGFVPDLDEGPCPSNGLQPVENHHQVLWVPVSGRGFDQRVVGIEREGPFALTVLG